MQKNFFRKVLALDLEEKILNIGVIVGMMGILFPWIGGEWLGGESVYYTGFQFYTGYIGMFIFTLFFTVLLITILPFLGVSIAIKKRNIETYRMLFTMLATILTLASLSVLTKTTREFVRMDLRFGIYMTIIGGLVASLYSFLKYQEQKKHEAQDIFHYPQKEIHSNETKYEESINNNAANMSPPPPSEPEDHTIFASALKK